MYAKKLLPLGVAVEKNKENRFICLPKDVKSCIMSFVSGTDHIDIMYDCLLDRDKFILQTLFVDLNLLNVRMDGEQDMPLLMFVTCNDDQGDIDDEMIDYILGLQGFDIDAGNGENSTALMAACHKGRDDLVKKFIENGANYNYRGAAECSPLMLAVSKGHTNVVETLINSAKEMEGEGNVQELIVDSLDESGWTPLTIACQEGDAKIVDLLVAEGACPWHVTKEGHCPIHLAANGGHFSIVKSLIDAARNHDKSDITISKVINCPTIGDGFTPLMFAAQHAHYDIVKLLVETGAKMSLEQKDGCTAMHVALLVGHLDIVLYLIEQGTDINIKDVDGMAPLHIASESGYITLVRAMIAHGADVDILTDEGATSLQSACSEGHLEIVFALIEAGAALNIQDDTYGHSPLGCAAANGLTAVVKALIDAGADIDITAHAGETPIMMAICNNHLGPVEALIEAGCDLKIHDDQDNTAFDYSRENPEIRAVLWKEMAKDT